VQFFEKIQLYEVINTPAYIIVVFEAGVYFSMYITKTTLQSNTIAIPKYYNGIFGF